MTTYNTDFNTAHAACLQNIAEFNAAADEMTAKQLTLVARDQLNMTGYSKLRKAQLLDAVKGEYSAQQHMQMEEAVEAYELQLSVDENIDEALFDLEHGIQETPETPATPETQATEFGPEACEEEPVDYELTEAVNDEDFYSTKETEVAQAAQATETEVATDADDRYTQALKDAGCPDDEAKEVGLILVNDGNRARTAAEQSKVTEVWKRLTTPNNFDLTGLLDAKHLLNIDLTNPTTTEQANGYAVLRVCRWALTATLVTTLIALAVAYFAVEVAKLAYSTDYEAHWNALLSRAKAIYSDLANRAIYFDHHLNPATQAPVALLTPSSVLVTPVAR